MSASEAQAEAAIIILKQMIHAAENGNQAGEDAVVAAACGLTTLAALQGVMGILSSAESNASGNPEWGYVGQRVAAARAAVAKASGK